MVIAAGQPGSGKTYTMKGFNFSQTENIDLRERPSSNSNPQANVASNEFIKASAYENRVGITIKCLKEIF